MHHSASWTTKTGRENEDGNQYYTLVQEKPKVLVGDKGSFSIIAQIAGLFGCFTCYTFALPHIPCNITSLLRQRRSPPEDFQPSMLTRLRKSSLLTMSATMAAQTAGHRTWGKSKQYPGKPEKARSALGGQGRTEKCFCCTRMV
jgi:hypothetical protein